MNAAAESVSMWFHSSSICHHLSTCICTWQNNTRCAHQNTLPTIQRSTYTAVQKQQEVTKNLGFDDHNTTHFGAPNLYANAGDNKIPNNDDAQTEDDIEMDIEAAMEEVYRSQIKRDQN